MSDIEGGAPAAEPTGAAPAAPADSGASVDSYTPIDLPDGQQLFERSYVEKLREESAKYRTQLREVQQQTEASSGRYGVLDQYDDDDRAVWLGLAETWQNDPYAAAETMRTIASRVLGDIEQGTASDEFYNDMEQADQAEPGGVTPEQVQQIVQAEFQRQQQAQEMETLVEGIYGEIREAGVDPNSMEGYMVLWRASNETNGDVKAALEAHNGYKQQIVDGYVAQKASGGNTPPPANGTMGQQKVEIKGLDDAFRMGREFLQNQGNVG